jgi:hypothetical protein
MSDRLMGQLIPSQWLPQTASAHVVQSYVEPHNCISSERGRGAPSEAREGAAGECQGVGAGPPEQRDEGQQRGDGN